LYNARFRYVYGLLLLVAAAGIITGLYMLAVSPRVEVRHKADAPLTSSSTVSEVRGKFSEQPTAATGEQIAPELAAACPNVDIYKQADGFTLVCHA
jgi:hypothetical protein